MRVVCYARVSSERQAEKDLSIPAQLKALRRYALDRNWELVGEYIDEAESARTANRPKFKEMIAGARRKSKSFEVILVWKLSRFARNREDSVIYKSLLKKHGVQVISINEPVDSSAAGKLLEGMIEVIDEFYSTSLAEDTVRGMKENAERGFYNGGRAPYGYIVAKSNEGGVEKSRLHPEESEIPVVKRVFQMAAWGEGGKDIARALNRDGLRTRAGLFWGSTVINYMLRNAVYTGSLVWAVGNGEVICTRNAHPALVSGDDFQKVQQLVTDRRPVLRHPRTVASQYVLSSLIRCAKCGAAMIGATAKSGRYHYYKCGNHFKRGKEACPAPSVSKNKIEGFVVDRLKEVVLTDKNLADLVRMVNEETRLLAGGRQERLEEIEKRLESSNQKLLRLYVALETGKLELDDLAPRIKELRAEQTGLLRAREEALTELGDAEPKGLSGEQVLAYARDLKAVLSEGTVMEQKSFLRSFTKTIEFEPGQVAIDYVIPMPLEREEDRTSQREVLSFDRLGSPSWIRTNNLAVNPPQADPLYVRGIL